MSVVTQLYKDKERKIKAYPKAIASETYMSDKVTSVEDILKNTVLKPENGSSSQRPASPLIGKMFYDTTLSKPIWFDGTVWKDATGTEV